MILSVLPIQYLVADSALRNAPGVIEILKRSGSRQGQSDVRLRGGRTLPFMLRYELLDSRSQ